MWSEKLEFDLWAFGRAKGCSGCVLGHILPGETQVPLARTLAVAFHSMVYEAMMRHKAVLERYVALRCLWHEMHDVERTNRLSPCAVHVVRRPVRACVAGLVCLSVCGSSRRGAGRAVRRCGRRVRQSERAVVRC
eukprot:5112027-Prymnesium_polylepis.1